MNAFILIVALLDPTGALISAKPVMTFDSYEDCAMALQPGLEAAIASLDDKNMADWRAGKFNFRLACIPGDKS